MSSVLQPVGPEPASTYWRRRIAVLLAIVAALALIWWIISPGSSETPAAAPSTSPSPLPTVSQTSPSPSPSPTESGAECLDGDIEVAVTMDQQDFPVAGPVTFVMTIANTGTTACSRDVGTANNTFVVTSGDVDVWSSDDCAEAGESQIEEIPPGEAFAVKGTWDATVTSLGCEASTTPAQAGGYQVSAVNGGITSETLSFSLS